MGLEDERGRDVKITVVRSDRSVIQWINGGPEQRCCICGKEGAPLIKGRRAENMAGLFCANHERDAETSTVEVYK